MAKLVQVFYAEAFEVLQDGEANIYIAHCADDVRAEIVVRGARLSEAKPVKPVRRPQPKAGRKRSSATG